MNLYDEIVKADITPEKLVRSFKNIVEILKIEERPAMTFEVSYIGDTNTAVLDMNVVQIDSEDVDESVWESILESNFSSEILLELVKKIETRLADDSLYKVPVSIGLKPVTKGCAISLDLRVFNTEEEN